MSHLRWIFLSTLVCFAVADSVFNKVVLNTSSPAKCLDGSPAAHFISNGTGANKNKFVLYFEGGITCFEPDTTSTLESCYNILQTNAGSSKYLPTSFNGQYAGIVSGDPAINPAHHDWTRVIFLYCDGSFHQGWKSSAVAYKGTDMWFRGQNITLERFAYLNRVYGLNTNATDILLAGSEDGAIAALQWANHLQQNVKGKVKAVVDSGILLNVVNPTTGKRYFQDIYQNILKTVNFEVTTPDVSCNIKYPTEKWRCFFFENLYSTITVPLFVVDTLYDAESISLSLGIDCDNGYFSLQNCNTTEMSQIESYKNQVHTLLQNVVKVNGNGAWAAACVSGGSIIIGRIWRDSNYQVPANSGYLCNKAVSNWVLGVSEPENHNHVDNVNWPNNKACSGVMSNLRMD